MANKSSWFLLTALLLGAAGVYGQLLNGGFEDPDIQQDNPYGDIAAHWGRWGNWMNRETAWEPTQSGTCLMGYHHWEIREDTSSGFYQDVTNVPAGSVCVFGLFAYKDPGTDAEFVELRLERLGGFHVLANRTYLMKELRASWQRLWIKATNETAGIRVLVNVKPKELWGRNGALKFDEAELTVLPPESSR